MIFIKEVQKNPEKYAAGVIADFRKNNTFDPFSALMGTENKNQALYGLSVNFLHNLEEAKRELAEKYINDIKKLYGYDTMNAGSGSGSLDDLDALEARCLGPSID